MNSRVDYRFCFLYVIGSFSVVLGHCGNGINLFFDWFAPYTFHLPLFLFCSGYFYKKSSVENVKGFILHKVKTLILPLYVWNVIYAVFVFLTHKVGFTIGGDFTFENIFIQPLLTGHQFGYNLGSWFVAPLFFVQMVNVLFRKVLNILKIKEQEVLLFIGYFVLSILGVWVLSKTDLGQGALILSHTFEYLPYFALGTLYRYYLEDKDKLPNLIYFAIIFIMALALLSINGEVTYYNIFLGDIKLREPLYASYLQTIIAIMFWLRLSKILLPVYEGSKLVKLISDSAFSIMVNQFLGFMVIKSFFAVMSKFTLYFSDFDRYKFKTALYYMYYPKNDLHWSLIYFVAAIGISIFIYWLTNLFKNYMGKKLKPKRL